MQLKKVLMKKTLKENENNFNEEKKRRIHANDGNRQLMKLNAYNDSTRKNLFEKVKM